MKYYGRVEVRTLTEETAIMTLTEQMWGHWNAPPRSEAEQAFLPRQR